MKRPKAINYIQKYLFIRTKSGELKNLILNESQLKYYEAIKKAQAEGKPLRFIILKARQMGFSTLTEALIFYFTVWHKNVKSLIVAHDSESTQNIFKMSKLFYDMLLKDLKPMIRKSNAKELVFENPSKDENERELNPGLRSEIRVATSGSSGVGRGNTYQYVHCSEYAFWQGRKEETLAGIMQAVPDYPGTFVAIESTANGFDHFQQLWQEAVDGKNGFIPLFFPWYEMSTYRRKYDGFILTDEELELAKMYNLDLEQLAWRRWCIATNCNNDIDTFRQEYPAHPDEAFILSGNPVFNNQLIFKRITELSNTTYDRIDFVIDYVNERIQSFRPMQADDGIVRIYQHPIPNHPYVIGGDTAGEGSDAFVAHVIDNTNGKTVAVLTLEGSDETYYTRTMYCLGKYYNNALIGIEVNFGTYPIKELLRLGYTNQYRREKEDTLAEGTYAKFGWRTTSITRPNIIAVLKDVINTSLDSIEDVITLRECLKFIKNDNGRPEAQEGEHDDHVMSWAIAHAIRNQQSFNVIVEEVIDEEDDGFDSFLSFGK